MTIRRVLAVGIAMVSSVAGAACGGDDDGGATRGGRLAKATLVLNWTPNAHHLGVYAAQREGWYEDAGIDLKIVEPTSAPSPQVVGAGEAAFGISEAESVLPARAQGVPVVSIATILAVNDSALMSLAGDGITRPADLAGKTYGGYGGPLETELIARLVECDGADPAQVNHVEVGNIEYLPGMDADRFDSVWIFAGWDALRATEIEGRDVDLLRFDDYRDCIPNWYTPLFITNEDTMGRRPELVRDFLDATARGYALAIEDPQRAADLMLEAVPEMDEDLLRAAADYYAPRFAPEAPFGTQDRATWAAFDEFLVDAGLLDETVPVESTFTDEFLPG